MESKTKMFATVMLVLLGIGATLNVQAQPDLNNAPKGGNPPNREKRVQRDRKVERARNAEGKANKVREARMDKLAETEAKRVEALSGKALTDEQKQQLKEAMAARINALRAAQDAYLGEVAKMSGLTIEQLRLKLRDKNLLREDRRGRRDRADRDAAPANRAVQGG